jgi:hypothetical protein
MRNGLGRSGRVRRSTMIPAETITNAISVPMLTRLPDGRVLVDRVADLSGASAVVSLEWLRELRMLLGPPAASLPR